MYRDWACSWERHIFHTDGKEGGREVQTKLYFSVCWEGCVSPCAAGDEITAGALRGGGHSIGCPFLLYTLTSESLLCCSCICNAFIQILPFSLHKQAFRLILTSLPKFHWSSHSFLSQTHLLYGFWIWRSPCFFFDLFSNIFKYSTLFLLVHCYSQCSWM